MDDASTNISVLGREGRPRVRGSGSMNSVTYSDTCYGK